MESFICSDKQGNQLNRSVFIRHFLIGLTLDRIGLVVEGKPDFVVVYQDDWSKIAVIFTDYCLKKWRNNPHSRFGVERILVMEPGDWMIVRTWYFRIDASISNSFSTILSYLLINSRVPGGLLASFHAGEHQN